MDGTIPYKYFSDMRKTLILRNCVNRLEECFSALIGDKFKKQFYKIQINSKFT